MASRQTAEGTSLFRAELKHCNYQVTVYGDAPRSVRQPTCGLACVDDFYGHYAAGNSL